MSNAHYSSTSDIDAKEIASLGYYKADNCTDEEIRVMRNFIEFEIEVLNNLRTAIYHYSTLVGDRINKLNAIDAYYQRHLQSRL